MRKQPEMKTHWRKHSPLVNPMLTQIAMQWVMTKQQPTGIQTAMTTPPPRHLHQATHPNASPTLTPHPGKHSAPMKLPAKPPGTHWALPASSLALALRPHSVKLTRSATPKQKKWVTR